MHDHEDVYEDVHGHFRTGASRVRGVALFYLDEPSAAVAAFAPNGRSAMMLA